MKKIVGIIFAVALVFSIGATNVFAASGRGHHGGGHGSRTGYNSDTATCNFTDENNDGICDTHKENCTFVGTKKTSLCGTHKENCVFVDTNNDGVCDTHKENCKFVDTNKNGICDTHNENCKFIDSNKDDVCDTCLSGCTRPQDTTVRENRRGRGRGCHNR